MTRLVGALALFTCLTACNTTKVSAQSPSEAPEPNSEAEAELARLGEVAPGAAEDPKCTHDPASVALLEQRCTVGSRDACIQAALAHWRGCGVAQDNLRAEELFATACGLGSVASCSMQAYLMGQGPSPRVEEARKLYERTCHQGLVRACGNLGIVLTTKLESPSSADVEKGIQLIHRACVDGPPYYCAPLLLVVEKRNVKAWFERARNAVGHACNAGNLDSCYALGNAVEDGTVGMQDYVIAARLHNFACERGHMPSCNSAGYMMIQGHGYTKDPYAGAALFYYACGNGFAAACDSFGEAMENGWGFKQDKGKAAEFYRYACSMGHAHSCKRLELPTPSAGSTPVVPLPAISPPL
ncbi:MAG TPA: tetratricopeptide repeat protein [Polyangiaceae bacterium]|nr:tetratricopeptide repeat protein [Polyangiaceae bacterium]